MQRLRERNAEDAFRLAQEAKFSPLHYEDERVLIARKTIGRALMEWNPTGHHRWGRIIELGCGAADISGFFSWGHNVLGYDANFDALASATKRWPWATFGQCDIQTIAPHECDVLVLGNVLSHVADPVTLCSEWLPKVQYAFISAPLHEKGLAPVWDFDGSDFYELVDGGQHIILDSPIFQIEGQPVWMAVTRRKASE